MDEARVQICQYVEDGIKGYMVNHDCSCVAKFEMCSHIMTAYTILDMYLEEDSYVRDFIHNCQQLSILRDNDIAMFAKIKTDILDKIEHTTFYRAVDDVAQLRDLTHYLLFGDWNEPNTPSYDPAITTTEEDTSVAEALMKII
ncbi:hypothetical protein Mpsy_2282 [Methanolobus psychrophilus R15]|nr:hypothetical protein Mpsy_2282 [Methanolobus psychrophilus R15]